MMRTPFLYSVAMHSGILVMALVVLPGPDQLPVLPSTALPVDLVTIDEFTNLKKAPKRTAPEPEIKPEPAPEEKPKAAAKPAPPPPPQAKPEPAPPPPPPEPKKVAEAKPAAKPEPRPKPKPKPPRKAEKKKPDPTFDPTRIAALLDKMPQDDPPPDAAREKSVEETQVAAASSGFDAQLTLSEIDAFKVQMRRCWSVPAGAANAEDLVVQIKVHLNPDGSLAQPPKLINQARLLAGDAFFRTAAESAMRAIRRCQPFKMPASKYSNWRELDLNFDPREMLGG